MSRVRTTHNFWKILKKHLTNIALVSIICKELAEANRLFLRKERAMNLLEVLEGKEYIIDSITTDDDELDAFLFSLGCYGGEPITVISRRRGGMTVSIKDGRYHIDRALGEAIEVRAV